VSSQVSRDRWLSSAKAQVITRSIDRLPGDLDVRRRGVEFMLDHAKKLDATELAKAGRHLVGTVDPDDQARREERELDREERAVHPTARRTASAERPPPPGG
jgi:hypothetical protein